MQRQLISSPNLGIPGYALGYITLGLSTKLTMSYTYVQEIAITVTDGSRFTVYISNTQGNTQFELEVLLRDPSSHLTTIEVPPVHASAEAAFNEAVVAVKHYLSKTETSVDTIDSPCNAPFIGKTEQASVLHSQGIGVAPTVNRN